MTDSNGAFTDPARSLRFCLGACALGLLASYCLAFPLKWLGLMPDRLTWFGLFAGPAAMFACLASLFAGLLLLGRRWWLLFVPVVLLSLAVLIALNMANWSR